MDNPQESVSIWEATVNMPSFSSLQQDIETDVCVVGAGIAGVTTAYLLSTEGKSVILIDSGEIGSGETGRTTAHLFTPDDRYFNIEHLHGEDGARIVAESFYKAIDTVERIINDERISCDFERLDGYLFVQGDNDVSDLDKELDAARRAGVNVDKVTRAPIDSFDTGPCLRFACQGQFHPLKYLAGLSNAIIRNGSKIFTNTRARDIEGGKHAKVITEQGNTIHAKALVVATNTPINNRVVLHTKQAGYQTYVIGVKIPKEAYPKILLWDTGDPYYYLRMQTIPGDTRNNLLIVGGEDHKVGQDEHPEPRYERLEQWTRQRFPMAEEILYRWSGEVMEPVDGVAFLGRNPMDDDNIYVITGDSGNGMTHCTIGAMLITDLIMGRENAWAKLYDPSRISLRAAPEFLKEQANTLAQYGDWAKKSDVDSAAQILPGTGAVMRKGVHKVAVYRDLDGSLHQCSAVCTHLGCVVNWNSAENSWDCPCHGSRYDAYGKVIHGPALHDLKAIESLETETTDS